MEPDTDSQLTEGQGLPAPVCSRTAETPEVDSHVHLNKYAWRNLAKKLERERNEARQWAANAAPILSRAACIVVEEAPERLREIEGVRAIIELCPVDFISENTEL